MRVYKHGCDSTRILINYVLSDVRFGLLVENMSAYQGNLLRSRSKWTAFSFMCCINFEKYFINRGFA